tara:strand:- start:1148 stop:2329 length:1182 start_codon:yes stop_codon:yes gene_type:complete
MNLLPKTIMLLGSGELGKEVTIAAQRLGCNVIACDRYKDAPAMQVADIYEVFDMNNEKELTKIIEKRQPDIVIPEIEALATDSLEKIEEKGITVIPNARATKITMNRNKIRNLASQELGIKTAKFNYASNSEELKRFTQNIGLPVLVKPIMSSSGKGQSLVKRKEDLDQAWSYAMEGARGASSEVIIEEYIDFDLEITLLTIRQKNGKTIFCDPIGHHQSSGDYQSSWQPAKISKEQLKECQSIATQITNNLGGVGLFGVEFFIKKNEVIFSELSPRPHDTGLVTLISQNINEFELHLRAVLGLPIPKIYRSQAAASRVILAKESLTDLAYIGVEKALEKENTQILLFGKPSATKGRRMGVALALDETVDQAQQKADESALKIKIITRNNEIN